MSMETDRAFIGVMLAAMTYAERVAYVDAIENALVYCLSLAPGLPMPEGGLDAIAAELDELAAGKGTR